MPKRLRDILKAAKHYLPLCCYLLACSGCKPTNGLGQPRGNPGAPSALGSNAKLGTDTSTTLERALANLPLGKLPLKQRVAHTGGADGSARLPWIIALHGLGDNPHNFSALFDQFEARAHVFLLEAPIRRGPRGFDWLGVSVRDREQKLAKALVSSAQIIAKQIDVLGSLEFTRGKPVVTGFSQGGMLSFTMAALYPKLVRGTVPIAGWLPRELILQSKVTAALPPIVVLHGEADPVVPLEPTRLSVEALKAAGYNTRLRTYPGVKHQIPREVLEALHGELEAMVNTAADDPR